MNAHLLFAVVTIGMLFYLMARMRSGHVSEVVLTTLATFVYLFCLWIPCYLQVTGILESKLLRAGFMGAPDMAEFGSLSVRWSLELVLLASAELVATVLFRRTLKRNKNATDNGADVYYAAHQAGWSNAKTVSLLLVAIGLAATVLFPSPGLDTRGSAGQGIPIMLRTCLVTGLAVIVYFRCFGSRVFLYFVIAGTLFLIAANVRSPLVVLFFAFLASQLYRWRSGVTGKKFLAISILVASVALIGSFMSTMRANLTRGLGLSIRDVFSDTFSNPLVGIYESGVDTLDGYRFSEKIASFEPARPFDLTLSILTFIPRVVWPDKPSSISVEMSSKYLGYKSSGQFLSPVGYLNMVTGNYIIGLLLLFLLAVLASFLIGRTYGTFWMSLVLVVCFRFLIGGSSFDIYYGLVLAVPIYLAKIVVDWVVRPYVESRNSKITTSNSQFAAGSRTVVPR